MKKNLVFAIFLLQILGNLHAQQPGRVVQAKLNGLEFVFDAETGGILMMSYPATGSIIQTPADSAGLVDLALPVKEFEPLRLATRFSKNARITQSKGMVTIHLDALGASRSLNWFKGNVSATVTLKEDPDGRSVSMSCKIENQSDHHVPQIVFPDFAGIIPFAGVQGTEFRTGGTVIKPFVDMIVKKEHDNFYAMYENMRWFHYGFVLDGKNLVTKWQDIGGRKGGLSIFSKDWGKNNGHNEGVYLKLSEITGKLRYMKTLNTDIAPGTSWQSAEFIITPHANGWAKGIIPYREYANQNIKKIYPMPDHVRDGLGYRTLWMTCTWYPEDPMGVNFTFNDLPKAALEAKENGLDQMTIWGWYREGFTLPLPPPHPLVGTEDELVSAVSACNKIGVNVSPFISVTTAGPKTAAKYGVTSNSGYVFDLDFLPMLNPRYSVSQKGTAQVPSSNKLWQEEVLSSTKHLIDIGVPSLAWDQYFNVGPGKYLDTVVTKIRKMAKEKDKNSTFSAEAGTNMENECDYLDYTWNWDYNDGCDYRALLSSLKGPRINLNIDRSLLDVKRGFADNLYLNVFPRKPDGVNGSDYISNYPELSKALKQCARLRKQFLNYFVNGTFIADCLLSADLPDAHVSAYALPKSMLVIVVNKGNKKAINFTGDIAPWLKSETGRYKIKLYNDGEYVSTSISGSQWRQKTPVMKNLDIGLYELIAE